MVRSRGAPLFRCLIGSRSRAGRTSLRVVPQTLKVNPLSPACLMDGSVSARVSLPRRHPAAEPNPPLAHQLAPNFWPCALRLARPLLWCHSSCPDAPRCPLPAIQLFIFPFPLPPTSPLRTHRLYDSRRTGGFSEHRLACCAPRTLSFQRGIPRASQGDRSPRSLEGCAPRSEGTPLCSKFQSDRGPGLVRVNGVTESSLGGF